MVDTTDPLFNPGGIQDRVDNRDYLGEEVGHGAAPFDWSQGYDIENELALTIPVKDQNGSSSCGGQAWATLAEVLEAAFTGTLEERSAKYVYAQTYQHGGGSTGRDNAVVFAEQGVARETTCPSYQNGAPPNEAFMTRGQDISESARQDAKFARAFPYIQVGTNIDSVAQFIRDTQGVILGIDGENNGTWISAFPQVPNQVQWRHWIYAGKAKMINGVKHIGCLNSWGDVGDHGCQWLPEAYFTSGHVWSGWSHIFNGQPIPPSFAHNFTIDLKFGMAGDEVKALQTALQIEGVFPTGIPATGFFGNISRDAVKKYQVKYQIVPSVGYVGPLTRARLNSTFNH